MGTETLSLFKERTPSHDVENPKHNGKKPRDISGMRKPIKNLICSMIIPDYLIPTTPKIGGEDTGKKDKGMPIKEKLDSISLMFSIRRIILFPSDDP